MSRIVTLVVPFLVGSSTTAVTAAIIQYHFSGTVGDIADEGGVLTGIVQLGDLYSATWKLESSVPDLDPNLYRGKFDAYSAVLGLPTVTVATAGFLQVTDHPSGDSLYFSSSAPAVAAFSLSLNDASGMALSSPSIPTNLTSLLPQGLVVFWSGQSPAKFLASIDTVEVTVVPESTTIGLLMLGIAGLLLLRRGSQQVFR